jgi:hypothetical protein
MLVLIEKGNLYFKNSYAKNLSELSIFVNLCKCSTVTNYSKNVCM